MQLLRLRVQYKHGGMICCAAEDWFWTPWKKIGFPNFMSFLLLAYVGTLSQDMTWFDMTWLGFTKKRSYLKHSSLCHLEEIQVHSVTIFTQELRSVETWMIIWIVQKVIRYQREEDMQVVVGLLCAVNICRIKKCFGQKPHLHWSECSKCSHP